MRHTRVYQGFVLAVFLLPIPLSVAQERGAPRSQEYQTFTYRSSVSEVRLVFYHRRAQSPNTR